jgi:hypothetical protein
LLMYVVQHAERIFLMLRIHRGKRP